MHVGENRNTYRALVRKPERDDLEELDKDGSILK
jgi:hypothetical protein